jgi:AcrR family transcriptional regulator
MAGIQSKKARRPSNTYARGRQRREKILSVAAEMIEARDVGEISLKEIAATAGVSVGSAYHFYANATDVFVALAERFMDTLRDAIDAPYEGPATESWQALFSAAVDRGVAVYAECPAYQKLILGGKAPPEIKLADRKNDELIGRSMIDVISRHFQMQDFPNCESVFFYATEIVDLMFTLSVVRDGKISPDMVEEAKVASIAYLRHYLPESLPRKPPQEVAPQQ